MDILAALDDWNMIDRRQFSRLAFEPAYVFKVLAHFRIGWLLRLQLQLLPPGERLLRCARQHGVKSRDDLRG